MIRTNNFNPETDTKLLCTCGHPLCDKRSVSQKHLDRIQVVSYDLLIPMLVTSGGRCPYHENEEHRTTPADHQKGNGIDIRAFGSTRGNLVRAGLDAGCNAIGVAKSFVHLGFREENVLSEHITMWVYS
jgi:hypothetical protein